VLNNPLSSHTRALDPLAPSESLHPLEAPTASTEATFHQRLLLFVDTLLPLAPTASTRALPGLPSPPTMAGLGMVLVAAAVFGRATTATMPNVIHIVMDDVGHNDLGYVNPRVKSPFLDELVASGVQLDHMYTFKECAPTRGSVMTGRYPFHFG